MRLLIVNPNTSAGVTARIDAAAQMIAGPGDAFTTISAAFGPHLIVTDADARQAADGVCAAVAAHRDPVQGIVLASFGDTGAETVRAVRPGLPVAGLAGAAFAAARAMGGPVGIVTFAPSVLPGLRDMARRHGLPDDRARFAALDLPSPGDPGTVANRHGAALAALARDMAADGAAVIVTGGGPLAGLARRIDAEVPVPVIDGVQAAIGLIRAAAPASALTAEAHTTTTS